MSKLHEKNLLNLFNHLLKARRLEERLVGLFTEGAFPGWIHSALGQEGVGVGIALNLRTDRGRSRGKGSVEGEWAITVEAVINPVTFQSFRQATQRM